MPDTKVRVVGSGFSVFRFDSKPVAWLEQVEDSGQRAFSDAGQPYQFIQPLGHTVPLEIATSRVLQGGVLTLTIREIWDQYVWETLSDKFKGKRNIVDIFEAMAEDPTDLTCCTYIKPPGKNSKVRGKVYNKCAIVDISDNDTITVGGLAVTKGVVVAYCYSSALDKAVAPLKRGQG